VSAAPTGLSLAAAVLALRWPGLLALSGLALRGVAILNRRFYALLWRRGGARLAGAGYALHLLYFVYSAASFVFVWLEARVGGGARPGDEGGR